MNRSGFWSSHASNSGAVEDRHSLRSGMVGVSPAARRATPGGGTALSFPNFSANSSLNKPPDIGGTLRKPASDLSNGNGQVNLCLDYPRIKGF